MRQTEAVISLDTIAKNAALVLKKAGAPLIAVVKDDGYGHGAVRVAHALYPLVRAFAVATAEEGAALRAGGVGGDIFVLSPCVSEEEALCCFSHGLLPAAASVPSMELLLRAAERFGCAPKCQLAVNTGMNRYGFPPAEVKAAVRRAERAGLFVEGVFSHFYAPSYERAREEQYRLFLPAAEEVKRRFPGALAHLSATGGILAGGKYNFDAVRSGIALYGYLPEGFSGALPVRPAMKVYARVSQRGKFTGGGAGYMRAEREYGSLNTLRLGYGDGFFRAGGFGVGALCMDACVREGELPFGRRTLVLSDVSQYAKRHGTNEYEALVLLGRGAEKIYV